MIARLRVSWEIAAKTAKNGYNGDNGERGGILKGDGVYQGNETGLRRIVEPRKESGRETGEGRPRRLIDGVIVPVL